MLTNLANWYMILTIAVLLRKKHRKDNYNDAFFHDDGYDDGHVHVHVRDDARKKIVIIVSVDYHSLY